MGYNITKLTNEEIRMYILPSRSNTQTPGGGLPNRTKIIMRMKRTPTDKSVWR